MGFEKKELGLMKTEAVSALREKLKRGEQTHGIFVSLKDASLSELSTAVGLDWVMIDCEHGHLTTGDTIDHIRATVRSNTCAFVRIDSSATLNVEGSAAQIKRVLDMGADGVMIPNVEDASVLETLIGYARFPPAGQ